MYADNLKQLIQLSLSYENIIAIVELSTNPWKHSERLEKTGMGISYKSNSSFTNKRLALSPGANQLMQIKFFSRLQRVRTYSIQLTQLPMDHSYLPCSSPTSPFTILKH